MYMYKCSLVGCVLKRELIYDSRTRIATKPNELEPPVPVPAPESQNHGITSIESAKIHSYIVHV